MILMHSLKIEIEILLKISIRTILLNLFMWKVRRRLNIESIKEIYPISINVIVK